MRYKQINDYYEDAPDFAEFAFRHLEQTEKEQIKRKRQKSRRRQFGSLTEHINGIKHDRKKRRNYRG